MDVNNDDVLSPDIPEISIDIVGEDPPVPMMGHYHDDERSQPKPLSFEKDGSFDEENSSDLSHSETDQLTELPVRGQNVMNRLVLPQRTFRRMSSPAVTGLPLQPKKKPNLSLKLSGNLESLDLKSSLPLSPTFFAKFGKYFVFISTNPFSNILLFFVDFSDPALIRLSAEVEEITSRICLPDDGVDGNCRNEFWWNPRSVQLQKI